MARKRRQLGHITRDITEKAEKSLTRAARAADYDKPGGFAALRLEGHFQLAKDIGLHCSCFGGDYEGSQIKKKICFCGKDRDLDEAYSKLDRYLKMGTRGRR